MTSSNIGTPQSVVFIDSNVPDLQDLLNGLAVGVEAFVIDPSSDGLAQIAAILTTNDLTNLSSISIVGHGAAGQIQVGSTTLDAGDLSSEAATLAQIGAALAPGGAFQLYACDTASGTAGQQFIAELSQYAGGATVAASSQDVGTLQGTNGLFENWTLDASTGAGDASVPFTAAALDSYQGLLAAPTVTVSAIATTLKVDADGDKGISPGDTITSSVTISDSGGDATGVVLSETPSGLTTIANSVAITPIGVNDSYTATGNVPLTVGAASGVLANDTEFNGGTLTAISPTNTTNGAVTLNADGSFTFTPTTGFSGTASFQYTADDAAGNSVDKATVTIAVGPPTWYVNSAASGTQDGTAAHPFATIQQAISAAAADTDHGVGDTINVATGSYSGADISLASGEKLIGAGSGGTTFTVSSGTAVTLGTNNTISGIKISNTGSGDGIDDSSSTGTTTMSNIAVTTSSGTGISFTHGGTVDITGTGNTISSSAGTALDVENTNIGSSGITFQSISSGAGGNDGIILENTGASGGLTVTGTGSAGSGGTIENKTGTTGGASNGVGIYLNNTADVSLAYMQLNNLSYDGIYGQAVTNFSMDHTVVDGANGSAVGEGSVVFGSGQYAGQSQQNGVTGTVSITNSTVSGGWYDNLDVFDWSGAANVTLANDTFNDNNTTHGNQNVYIDPDGTSVINATVTNSTWQGVAGGSNFYFDVNSTSTTGSNLSFLNNTVSDNLGGVNGENGSGGFQAIATGETGTTTTFDIENNAFSGATGNAVGIANNETGNGTLGGTVNLTFNNNTIGAATGQMTVGADNSGSAAGVGLEVEPNGGTFNASITNNHIYEFADNGIDVTADVGISNGNEAGTLNAEITGNTVEDPNSNGVTIGALQDPIYLDGGGANGGASDNFVYNATVGGSTAAEKNTTPGLTTTQINNGDADILVSQDGAQAFNLTAENGNATTFTSYTGPGSDSGGQVESFLNTWNSNGSPNSTVAFSNGNFADGDPTAEAPATGPTFDTPSISGTDTEGDTLTASDTGGSATSGVTYQWQESFAGAEYVDIFGANASTYTLKESDVGATIRVVATATYSDGIIDTADSAATGGIADDLTLTQPTISSTSVPGQSTTNPVPGQILTASTPSTDNSDATVSYQWQANGVNISGAIGQSFTVTSAQLGDTIKVVATAIDPHGGNVSETSVATTVVDAFVGQSLSDVSIGTLPGNDAVTVSWQATVNPQSDQLIVNPTYTGTVGNESSNFAPLTADGTVPLDTLSLEGEIFNDANGNGTLDGGEVGISGVSLSVFVEGSSTALESTTTNGSGVYDFTGLAAGNYYVQINALPSGYGNSSPVRDTTPNDYAGGKNYGLAVSGGVIDTNAITIAYDQPEPSSNGSTYPGDDTTSTLDIGLVQAPQIGGTGNTVQYYQGGAAKPLDSIISVTDSVAITSATVTITNSNNNAVSGDKLAFNNGSDSENFAGGVTITATQSGDELTLTTASGTATAADYTNALDTVTYSFSGDPTDQGTDKTRTVAWSVSDANSQTSAAGADTTLDVFALPIVSVAGVSTPTYTSTSGAVPADATVSITDYNGTTIAGATVTVTNSSGQYVTGDTLNLAAGHGVTVQSDIGGVLTLTGTASVSTYIGALEAITFSTTSTTSGTRTVTWEVNDEAGGSTNDSTPVATNVNVAFGPAVTGGFNIAGTEGASTGLVTLATFTDTAIATPTPTDFTATIDWGDNSTSSGTVSGSNGSFTVSSSGHTYAEEGPYTIAVTVTDDQAIPQTGNATDNAQVADAPLTPGTVTLSAGGVEGVTPTTLSAAFTDANLGAPTSDFSGTINWGDGNTTNFTSGDVAANGGGAFTVSGSHLYVEDGSDNVTVTINDVGGSQTIETGSTTVADAPLTEGTVTVGGGVEGTTPATLSAAFTDANAFATSADFSGTINWGDGNTTNFTSGDVAANGGGAFTVNGSHLYAEEGSDNVTVTINDKGGSQTIETTSTTVADAPLTAGTVTVGGGVEGTTPATLSAAFTDANVFATSTDFSGTIDWGDGNTTTFDSTAITQPGGIDTPFILNGTHTYVEDGPDNVTVTINDVGGSSTTETTSTTVADAPLTAGTVTVGGGVEGTTPATLTATFSDANLGAPTSDFSGTINWGDGDTTNFTSGDVAASGGGAFTVSGLHTYAENGSDNVTVTINDVGGSSTTDIGVTTVADAPLTAGTVTAGGGVEGVTPTTLSATFSDANTGAPTSDFSGTINWGDGDTTTFMSSAVTAGGGGNFTVGGSHQYLEEGTYTTTVTINDDGGSLNGNSSTTDTGMTTVADAPLTAGTVTLSAGGVEGVMPTTLSATFSDANTSALTTDFSGTIDWGDGNTTPFDSSALTAGGGGNFTVGGSHQYLEEGTYTTTVTINDDGGSANGNSSTTDTGVTMIADAPLTGSGVTENGTQDVPLTGPVATFTDANPNGSVSDFTATVTWGDGTAATSATITESGGVFTVTGTHTYTVQGTYMPTVSIVDDGGSTATVTDTFDIVHAPPTVTAGGTATYIGAGAVTLDAGVTVSDPDSGGTLVGATVTISTGFIAGDTLEIGGQTSGTITDSGGTINYAFAGTTLTLSGTDTLADYQAALDSITYSFTPSNGDATKGGTDTSRTISWTVNDGAPINGTSTAASTLLVPATPVVTAVAASVNASASESFTPAQLFSASDAAGEPILTYEVKDESGGANNGFWVLNGAVLPNGQITTLTAAQLSQLSFVAGSASTPVLDTLEVAASDAAGPGAFTSFTVTAAAHAPTTPPTVTAANELQAPNLSLAGSSLFSGTAFGGNTITSYEVEDTTPDSGHWVFNGTVEPTNQVIDVTVAQLAQLSFDTGYGSDTLMVRANDGTQWGSFTSFTVTPPPNAAPPAGTADTLVMLRNADGAFEFYDIGRNTVLLDGPLGAINPALQVAGVGGFNGADTADLLMRDPTTGVFTLYDVSNNNITGNVVVGQVGLEWTVSGLGDFSTRANETDMLMRNSNTGQFEVYDIANNAITFAGPMGQVGLEWSIAGFGDFSTRANETDMLMRNSNTGAFEVYDIANNAITFAGPMGQVGLEWSIAGFGDFSTRANETDMLMRNSNTGAFEVYDISNNTITSSAPMGQVGLEWTIAGFGDFSGNANETDMLMRNSNTGVFELYDINNNTIAGTASMGQVGLEWSISGVSATPAAAPPTAQLSSIAADPAGASLGQLTQAMASFGPADAATAASSPLGQSSPVAETPNLFAAASQKPSAMA